MAADPIVKVIYIEAPPKEVFEFLTDPAKMVRWMGLEAELDPQPGGKYRLDPNGRDVIQGTYLEVVPNSKIVFTWGWDQPGHRVPAGSTTVEIQLEARGEGTSVRLTHLELPAEAGDNHEMGWGHYLSRLKITAEGAILDAIPSRTPAFVMASAAARVHRKNSDPVWEGIPAGCTELLAGGMHVGTRPSHCVARKG